MMVGRVSFSNFMIHLLVIIVCYYATIWIISRAIADAEIREGFKGGILLSQKTKDGLFLFPRYWYFHITTANRFSWYIIVGAVWTHIGLLLNIGLNIIVQIFDIKFSREFFGFCIALMMLGIPFTGFIMSFRFVCRELFELFEVYFRKK